MKKIFLIIIAFVLLLNISSCNNNTNLNSDSISSSNNTTKEKPVIVEEIIYSTVSFETNGGTEINNYTGKELKEAPKTERENYHFKGWYLDSNFTEKAIFPLKINKDITLYAKWLKVSDKRTLPNTSIKAKVPYSDGSIYSLSIENFDLEELEKENYFLNVKINYTVYYQKEYDVLFDIGYFGAPKYDVILQRGDEPLAKKYDVTANKDKQKDSIERVYFIEDLKKGEINFVVSTENIQNRIFFEDIVVTFNWEK